MHDVEPTKPLLVPFVSLPALSIVMSTRTRARAQPATRVRQRADEVVDIALERAVGGSRTGARVCRAPCATHSKMCAEVTRDLR